MTSSSYASSSSCSSTTTGRAKRFRFDVDESELLNRRVEDSLKPGLDCVIVGINPGLATAYHGHHYSGPTNHFWQCLHASGIVDWPATYHDDRRLVDHGIGFTNIVERTTRGSADLSRDEIKKGAIVLRQKLIQYKPKVAVFNGIGIYEVFSGAKNFPLGLQQKTLEATIIFVMPSSSPRLSAYPTASSKMPFYLALKKLLDLVRNNQFQESNKSSLVFYKVHKDGASSSKDIIDYQYTDKDEQLVNLDEVKSSGSNEDVIVCSRYFLGNNDE